jgi:hypothetical protein
MSQVIPANFGKSLEEMMGITPPDTKDLLVRESGSGAWVFGDSDWPYEWQVVPTNRFKSPTRPNWFHRLMQRWLLGIRWRKVK